MVIRHAEKPDGVNAGVDETGLEDNHSLIVRGWQRAGALVPLFAPGRGPMMDPRLAVPQFLFASGSSDSGEESRSHRPGETIRPLSQRLGIEIDVSHSKGQEEQVAKAAQACDGVVLISWQHEAIFKIANAILGNTTAPQHWPGGRFDVVFVFTLDPASGAYAFEQVPQLLLAGDEPDGIQP